MKSSKKPQAAKVAVGATGAASAATEEKSFKCDICDCEFNNEIPYQAHMVRALLIMGSGASVARM